MKLEQTTFRNSETGCCAKLDPADWDGREFTWKDQPFLKDQVRSFLHIPLNFGAVMRRNLALAEKAEAYPERPFWLTDDRSPWGADYFLSLDREIPGASIERLSGRFLAKVFEGPYRHAGRWSREMVEFAAGRGLPVKKLYFYYATCPKCAKHYGKNQTVLFAQVE